MVSGFNHVDIGNLDMTLFQPGEPHILDSNTHSKLLKISRENYKPLFLELTAIYNDVKTKFILIMNCLVNSDAATYNALVYYLSTPVFVMLNITETEAYLRLIPILYE